MKSIRIGAREMLGGQLVVQRTFENHPLPDEMLVRLLKPGGCLKMSFGSETAAESRPCLKLTLSGFPGSFVQGAAWDVYCAHEPILQDLRLVLNGREVWAEPVYFRNHPDCDPLQQFSLLINPATVSLRRGRNTFSVENRGTNGRFAGTADLYLSSVTLAPSTGRLVNTLYRPDKLDAWMERRPVSDLKAGVGYETILRRDIPALVDAIAEDRIGNYLMIRLDNALNDGACADGAEILHWAELLTRRHIYFSLMVFRAPAHPLTPQLVQWIEQLAGPCFVSLHHHELGLIFSGHRRWREGYEKTPPASFREAYAQYNQIVRKRIAHELPPSHRPRMCSESTLLSHENLEAGIDFTVAELFPQHCGLSLASARGATRVHGKELWGAHLALLWTLGNGLFYGWDKAKAERFRLAARLAYFSGARLIYPESGLFNIIASGMGGASRALYDANTVEADSPVQRRMRHAIREINRLHAVHHLPADPETRIAFLRGELDPFVVGRKRGAAVMGVERLSDSEADSGWGLLDLVMPDGAIFGDETGRRADRWFAGSPFGQFDIIPASAPARKLGRYKLAVVPGWNTLSEKTYRHWQDYVRAGGTIVAAAPQLRTDERPGEARTFFRNGNVRSLFGVRLGWIGHEVQAVSGRAPGGHPLHMPLVERNVRLVNPNCRQALRTVLCTVTGNVRVLLRDKVSGEPVLVERRLGRGRAYLFTLWDYPGNPLALPLVRRIVEQALLGMKRRISVEGPRTLQHFAYRVGDMDVLALLDTNWTAHAAPAQARLRVGGREAAIEIPPHGLRFVYHRNGIFVMPESELCAVQLISLRGRRLTLNLFGFGAHRVEIAHPGQAWRKAVHAGGKPLEHKAFEDRSRIRLVLSGAASVSLKWPESDRDMECRRAATRRHPPLTIRGNTLRHNFPDEPGANVFHD